MRSIGILCTALAVCALGQAPTPAHAQTIDIAPQDTNLRLDAVNYSTDTMLTTYTWPDFKIANAALMKFDLSAIPAGATVQSATLNLSLLAGGWDSTADANYTVTVRKIVNVNPDVAAATGYKFAAPAASTWTANACCDSGVPLAQADLAPTVYATRAIDKTAGTKSFDLTALVQEWRSNPAANFGLVLNSDPSKARDRFRYFGSNEAAAGLKPFLRVVYTQAGAGGSNAWLQTAGLLWPNGIEPGTASACEAPTGRRCWWVDAQANDPAADGTFLHPYNSFEQVVGIFNSGNYTQGAIVGGDYLYVKGTFRPASQPAGKNRRIQMARGNQAGTPASPTVIKSWKGQPRAIFDGEGTQGILIDVLGSGVFGGLVVQNIEIARAAGLGMRIMGAASNQGSQLQRADVISVYAHDTVADAGMGTGGAITMHMEHSLHQYTVHNCVFVNNDVGHTGVRENRGSLTVVAETGLSADKVADPASTMKIYGNTFDGEENAIRHKHSGSVNVEAYNNIIRNSTTGFLLRIGKTNIHHNLLVGVTRALWLFDSDNRQGNMDYFFEHNTVYNAKAIIDAYDDTPAGQQGANYTRKAHLHDNLFVAKSGAQYVVQLGVLSDSKPGVSLSGWTFARNLYDLSTLAGSVPDFLYHRRPGDPAIISPLAFAPAMTRLGDTTSFAAGAQLVNPAGGDYRPGPASPAVGAGAGGTDIGALVH